MNFGLPIVFGIDGRGLDEEGEASRRVFLAQEPVEYLGHSIVTLTHGSSPHYLADQSVKGLPSFAYTGYTFREAPGAVWFRTVGQAKTMIDVLHEVGPRPVAPPYSSSRIASAEYADAQAAWNSRFWEAYRTRD